MQQKHAFRIIWNKTKFEHTNISKLLLNMCKLNICGKVKHELRVQISELRVQIHELQVQIHKLPVPIHELRVQIHNLRVQIDELED